MSDDAARRRRPQTEGGKHGQQLAEEVGRPLGPVQRQGQANLGQMTDDDCDVAEGKYDEMVGRIKTRTGEAEEEVRERLSGVL